MGAAMMDAARCLLLVMAAVLSVTTEATILKNTTKYPACLVDDDCLSYHKLADHACFQYFCYPYKKAQEELKASEAKELADLPPCSRKQPCKQPVGATNGKKPSEMECFKHHDKRRVSIGVCVGESENRDCVAHSDCTGDAGGRCCNGYCCGEEYFNAIKRLPCNGDLGCQVRT